MALRRLLHSKVNSLQSLYITTTAFLLQVRAGLFRYLTPTASRSAHTAGAEEDTTERVRASC